MPYSIAEAGFSGESDLRRGVRSQLGGGAVWADKRDQESQDGMMRALREAGPHRRLLASIVAQHLGDRSVAVRTGAVAVSAELGCILGGDALAELFETHQARLWGTAPRGHTISHPELAWALLVSIAGALTGASERKAIELLRRNVRGERGSWLLGGLAKHDTAWLLEHARDVVPLRSVLGVLTQLPTRRDRIALIHTLEWSKTSVEATLADPAWPHLSFPPEDEDELRTTIAQQA